MLLRPNAERARLAIILIWIVLGMEIIALVSDYFEYVLLKDIQSGSMIDPEIAEANDLRQRLIAIAGLAILIVSGVMFIRWFRRAYYNLTLKSSDTEYADGDAASCWFIPFINLFKPYQVMKDLYLKTETYLSTKIEGYQQATTFRTLGWWWSLWILHNVVGKFAFRYTFKAESIDDLINLSVTNMAAELISIPLALVAVLVIQDYAEKEAMMVQAESEVPENPVIEEEFLLQPE